ncbi:hypothetical protein HPB47_007808 [Ixodes persulcatus]|uniref:Uncharacterized protein n=1 Tax=Ixodes persulcatus TaxID=34615 RepID=A0AC60P6A6_IXOPE|nr:hypothetical protein HPB47_007808 [Ixodes persulcatus]
MMSTGTQTSADDLRVPSGPPSTSGVVRQTPPPSSRKDVGVPTPSKEQGLATLAPPLPCPPKDGDPGLPTKPAASKGQPLATTTDEPMDQSGLKSDEDRSMSGSEFSLPGTGGSTRVEFRRAGPCSALRASIGSRLSVRMVALVTAWGVGSISTTVSAAIRAVATAIVNCLGRQWVAFPQTDEEKAATREAFVRRGCLPGVVGCVDGTFVAIKAPSKHDRTVTKALYWCRKHYYALNVMVCDADMRILAFDPSMPGSTHDSFVWRRSWVRQECVAGRLLEDGEYLLGDEAYPLEPWLLSPVPGRPSLDSPAGRYNIAHASTRAVVERCIRLLKSRFRCLQRPRTLFHHPKIAGTIAAACAVLHNVCLCSEEPEPYPPSDSESESSSGDEDVTSDAAEERISVQSRCLYARGKAVRDRLVLTPCTSHLRRVRRRLHSLHPRRPH